MRTAVAIFMMLHGIAHLPGFVVPWRIATFKDTPYKTTLLAGRIDVGDVGIRIIGVLWLIVAIAFVVAGIAMIADTEWWGAMAGCVALISLVLSLLSLPEARIGVAVNIAILALLTVPGAAIGSYFLE